MQANKNQKEIIYQTPKPQKPNTKSLTMVIKQNNKNNNMNNLIHEKYDDSNNHSDNPFFKSDKMEVDKSKENYFNPGEICGIRLFQKGLKNGLIIESNNPLKDSVDSLKDSVNPFKENDDKLMSIIDDEDDIPEYDNLSEKIID